MHLPFLRPSRSFTETMDAFLGLNHNLRPGRGELYDMENLSSDLFPVLSPRKKRTVVLENCGITAMADRDGLCYTQGHDLYLNGKRTNLILTDQESERQLVSMGAYLIVLPDRKYINLSDPMDYGSIDAVFTSHAPVQICQCTLDGTEIRPDYLGSASPEDPKDNSYWLDYDNRKLKQYSVSSGIWAAVESPYVKIRCPGIGKAFSLYDGVSIYGDPGLQDLAGGAVLHGCQEDFIIIPGLVPQALTLENPVSVARKMPRLDFCIESGNRLWGCRYGPDDYGRVVNEIYCSKLGDFKNWSTYLGISTDSYTVSLGSEGPFTGAVNYGGHPIFFKENCLHKVFGTMPSDYSVQTMACRGVDRDCSKSLAIINEVLYYKTRGGICAYDGSLPRDISEKLGKTPYSSAVAGTLNGKYYISLKKPEGFDLMVFDTGKGLWHREDGLQAKCMCACSGELFCVDGKDRLLGLTGVSGQPEADEVSWMAEFPMMGISLPGNKYLKKLSLRMLLEPGSRVSVLVQYDSAGPFERIGTVRGMNLRSFVLPVLPRRCDHLKLRLEGEGRALLFSVSRVLRPGSDS